MCQHSFKTRDIYGKPVKVPCGNCLTCIATSRIFKSHRVMYDVGFLAKKGIGSTFLTLTIEDGFADTMSLHKSDFQKFMKRLRKNSKLKFKHVSIGDYGETHARPHYHSLLIGLPDEIALPYAKKSWKFGFVDVEPITSQNCNYVLRYISLIRNKNYRDLFASQGLDSPFYVQSRGIGEYLFSSNFNHITERGKYFYKGRFYNVPPYYLSKYGLAPNNPDLSRFITPARRNGMSVERYLDTIGQMREFSALRKAQSRLAPPQGIKNLPNSSLVVPTSRSGIDIDSLF